MRIETGDYIVDVYTDVGPFTGWSTAIQPEKREPGDPTGDTLWLNHRVDVSRRPESL